MSPTRSSTPASRQSTPVRESREHPETPATPSTPRPSFDRNGNVIMGSQSVGVPPSPGAALFDALLTAPGTGHSLPLRNTKARTASNALTAAGVKKSPVKKTRKDVIKLAGAITTATASLSELSIQRHFRFMDLPGEIRNMVYLHTYDKPKQALLVHRPRMASLRPRTRLDRSRTLTSDITDEELSRELASKTPSRRSSKAKVKNTVARETNRPFFGLTQVCAQLRKEYRPIYLAKQEIGMDLTEIVQYLQTFYFDSPAAFAELFNTGSRGKDMPFTGNLTIAVGDRPTELERSANGVEVIELLDLWANSFKIEAGFGRYLKAHYVPERDGEAKDLYRLFGRKVQKNRSCSSMDVKWRSILRNRSLASVTIHRKPASRIVPLANYVAPAVLGLAPGPIILPDGNLLVETKPYIHILFKRSCAESWMTQRESDAPVDWLEQRGFGAMEHFDVRVGVAV